MKIIHIITRLILGGAQENTLLTCREQARLGHDVVLLTGPPLGPEGSLLEAARGDEVRRSRGEGGSFRTVLVPALRRAVRPWTDLVAYGDILKNLREERPDVVHTHSSKAGILGRRAARAAGVRCIVHTIHGLAFDAWQGGLANWAYRTAERRAARWSHRLIAVCADMADRAAEAGLAPRDRIAVIYSGIDPAPFLAAAGRREEIRRQWNVDANDFVFLKIARLFHLKGHEFVLPAFAAVARRHAGARLVLAGEGILRPRLEAEVRRLGIAGRVTFLGLVPPEEIPGLLWASDAVVHAGLREGLARVLPQAGLCKRPVISYDVGGAREVIRDGENGLLLAAPSRTELASLSGGCHWRLVRQCRSTLADKPPVAPIARLAEAMERLAADPAAARRMGDRWPDEVLRPFDYRDATARIMRVYEEVLRD